jgi:hypothetical protein
MAESDFHKIKRMLIANKIKFTTSAFATASSSSFIVRLRVRRY